MPTRSHRGLGGRPTAYTPDLAERICQRLAAGETLLAICEGKGFPTRRTVSNWTVSQDGFLPMIQRAREEGVSVMAEKVVERALKSKSSTAVADRLAVDAIKWYASKISPRTYGDKLETIARHQLIDEKAEPMTSLDLARRIAFAFANAADQRGGEGSGQ